MPEELNKVTAIPVLIEDPMFVPTEVITDVGEATVAPARVTEDSLETEFVSLLEPEELSNVVLVPVLVSAELDKVAVFNPPVYDEDNETEPPELIIEVAVVPDGPENSPEVVLVMPEELNNVAAMPELVPTELISLVDDIEDPVLVPPEIIIDVVEDPVPPARVTEDPLETEFVPLLGIEELNNVTVVPMLDAAELDEVAVFNPSVNNDDIKDPVLVSPEIIIDVLEDPVDPDRETEDPLETEFVPLLKAEAFNNVIVVLVFVPAELTEVAVLNPPANVKDAV